MKELREMVEKLKKSYSYEGVLEAEWWIYNNLPHDEYLAAADVLSEAPGTTVNCSLIRDIAHEAGYWN